MDEILLQSGFIVSESSTYIRQELCDQGEAITITRTDDSITVNINTPKRNSNITETFSDEDSTLLFLRDQNKL
jgi:hypothetical protein